MKKLIILIILAIGTFTSKAQQQFVVQSVHSQGATDAVLDSERNLLITYGYQDKTLKFWNERTGLLYKTIDLEGYVSDIEINNRDGKTYVLTNNTVIVYSNESFKEINRYESGRIYAMDFFDTPEMSSLTVFVQNTDGSQGIYAIDESNGDFIAGNIPVFTEEGEVSHFEFSKDYSRVYIQTNLSETYVYSFDTAQFYEIKGYPIAMLDNGDVIMGIYDGEAGRASYKRMNPITRTVIWSQDLQIEGVAGVITPYRGDVAINKDGKTLWVAPGESLLVELDAKAGFVLGKIYREELKTGMIATGDYLYVQSGMEKPYAKFERYDKNPLVEYGHNVLNPDQIAAYTHPEEQELVFTAEYGDYTFSLLANDLVTRLTNYKTTYQNDYSDGRLIVDQKSDIVFSVTKTTDPIKTFQRGRANSFENLIDNINDVRGFDYASDINVLATLSTQGLRVIDTEKKSEIYTTIISRDLPLDDGILSLSPTGKTLAYTSQEPPMGEGDFDRKLHCFDYSIGKEIWSISGEYSNLKFNASGTELFAINDKNKSMVFINPKDGAILRSYPFKAQGYVFTAVHSPDENYVLINGSLTNTVLVYEKQTGALVNSLTNADFKYTTGTFVSNTVVAVAASGAIKFYDVLSGNEVMRMYIFRDASYIAYTPEGYFEGSQNAWNKVAFVNKKEVIPLESVFDKFYTPRLVHQILSKQPIEKRDDITKLKAPPSVTIEYKEGTRNLVVEDDVVEEKNRITQNQNGEITLIGNPNNDRIIEMRLYHNGKLVSANARNLVVEDDVKPNGITKKYPVTLVPGSNEFLAIAVNSQLTESQPARIIIEYQPIKSKIEPQGIQAHVLVVGIDAYKNPKYNLNYAVADATSFKESVTSGIKNITSKIHVYEVKNEEANRDNILSKFTEIATLANPQDIFLFYYAGHGMVTQEGEKEFFLVPNDVTQIYGNDGGIRQKGIAASELKTIASGIAAQKQLYILDACQSAGALTTIASRGAAEEKAIAQLARSTGTHWLTASGSEQFATEFDELGHGVFTYALLEALSGKADSGDSRITVNEVKAYLESRVPEISEQYKGNPQYPSSFGFGQDFPVGIKN